MVSLLHINKNGFLKVSLAEQIRNKTLKDPVLIQSYCYYKRCVSTGYTQHMQLPDMENDVRAGIFLNNLQHFMVTSQGQK